MRTKLITLILILVVHFTINAQTKLSEGFEGKTFPPNGWKVINNNSNDKSEWKLGKEKSRTGKHCSSIKYSNKNHDAWLITPKLVIKNGDIIKFWAKNKSSGSKDKFNVKISTTGTNPTDFNKTLETNCEPGTSYEKKSYDLSTYAGKNIYIAIQAISKNKYCLYIDDFTGPEIFIPTTPPNFSKVIFPINNGTNTKEFPELKWESVEFASKYKLYVGSSETNLTDIINGVTVTETSYEINTKLSYATKYFWKVVPFNKNGDASNCPIWNFTLLNDPSISNFPYTESFESNKLAKGWSIIDNNNDNKTWELINKDGNINKGCLKTRSSYNGGDDWLISPPIKVKDKVNFSFFAKSGSSYANKKINVKLSTSSSSIKSFTTILASNVGLEKTTYKKLIYDLSSYANKTVYVAIQTEKGNYAYVDDVKIFIPSSVVYKSCTPAQIKGDASIGAKNIKLIKIPIKTTGEANGKLITKFSFNLNGSTKFSDIEKVNIFYTKNSNDFSTKNKFGTINITTNKFSISGSQQLVEGINYFWLAVDIDANAKENNLIDAELTSIISNSQTKIIENPTIEGNRTLKHLVLMPKGLGNIMTIGNAIFYDDGGKNADYSKNFSGTITFLPKKQNSRVRLDFTEFSTSYSSNTLKIYNGKSVVPENKIGQWFNTNSPGVITSKSEDGALTVTFKSNNNTTKKGWVANISNFIPENMKLKASEIVYDLDSVVPIGGTNKSILRLKLTTSGELNKVEVNNIKFSLTKTSNISDVKKLKIYFTGQSNKFSSKTLFGETDIKNIKSSITGKAFLNEGDNYFWISADISDNGIKNNKIFIAATEITTNLGNYNITQPKEQIFVLNNIILMTSGLKNSITISDAIFYDNGGSNNNYAPHFEGSLTIFPKDRTKKIEIDFTKFDVFKTSSVGYNDIFRVYEGSSTDNSFLLGQYLENPGIFKSSAENGSLTIYFKAKAGYQKSGWEASVKEFTPLNMKYISSNTIHPSLKIVSASDTNKQLLRIKIVTDNTLNALKISKLNLELGETTSPNDISKVKVYYTGASTKFSNKALFGEISKPDNKFVITGTQALKFGENYIWICYDLSNNAKNSNSIDAVCNSIVIGNRKEIPTTTSPDGKRTIDNTYNMPVEGSHIKKVYSKFDFTDDNKGLGGKYSKEAMSTVTFQPSKANEKIKITMSEFDILIQKSSYGTKAVFKIYNGKSKSEKNLIYEAKAKDASTGPTSTIYSSSEDGCLTIFFVGNAYSSTQTKPGWKASIASYYPENMFYKYSVQEQGTSIAQIGGTNQLILSHKIKTEGNLNAIDSIAITYSTKGSSDANDIENAKLFYTGRDNSFNTNNPVGDTIQNPNGEFSFNCLATLLDGDNYFWLTYDINSNAKNGNVIDAKCIKIGTKARVYQMSNDDIDGNSELKRIYELTKDTSEVIVNSKPTLFYDDGGIKGLFTKEIVGTVTFTPESKDQKVRLEISMLDISSMDDFYVYNGAKCIESNLLAKMDEDENISKSDEPYVFKSTSEDGKITVKFRSTKWSTAKEGWEAKIFSFIPKPVSFKKASYTQTETKSVLKSESNVNMLQLEVSFLGETTPADITSFTFSTLGTTVKSDIISAKLFYTKSSNEFNIAGATKYGKTVMSPRGDFSFSGTKKIASEDKFYFWLVYDIAKNANTGNILNANCKSLTVNNTSHIAKQGKSYYGRKISEGLSGEFTIGINGDFTTFTSAVDALAKGVEGPVVFKIKSGVYLEQVKIPEIQGTSEVNTVTFKSESGFADDVKFIYNKYSSTGYGEPKYGVFTIEGADYLHFENITFKTTNKSMTALLLIRNVSTNLVFEGNKFIAPYAESYNSVRCVCADAENKANRNNNNLTFKNNLFSGGYYGLDISGTGYVALPKEFGHKIINNIFKNQGGKSLWFGDILNGEISNNLVINSETKKNNFCGIEIYRATGNTIVSNNKVIFHVTSKDIKGINLREPKSNIKNGIKVFNNMVSIFSTNNSSTGISVGEGENISIYHNTVKIFGTGESRTALYLNKNINVNIKNNILINKSQGSAIEFRDPDKFQKAEIVNNNIYVTGSTLCKVKNVVYPNIEKWKQTTKGVNSISEDVEFYSNEDLHIKIIENLNRNTIISFILKDIDNDNRSKTTPTIGADEFTPLPTTNPEFKTKYPKLLKATHYSANFVVNINRTGKIYFMALKDNSATPSVSDVKIGTIKNNKNGVIYSSYSNINKNIDKTILIKGFGSNNKYQIYFIAEDNLGNISKQVIKLEITTKYKPTETSSFETSKLGAGIFTDGTAEFKGVSTVFELNKGADASNRFIKVFKDSIATISITNTNIGIVLNGFFIKSSTEVIFKGKKADGSFTSSITVSPEKDWTYVDMRDLGKVKNVIFNKNSKYFLIDNFSALPLPIKISITPTKDVKDANSVKLITKVTGGVKPYKFLWSSGETIDSPSVTPSFTSNYTITVTDKYKSTATKKILINVKSNESQTATFEEFTLTDETYWMGDENSKKTDFYSGSFKFNNFYSKPIATWCYFAISNETSNVFETNNFVSTQFRNASGGGFLGKGNYAVVYNYGCVPEIKITNSEEGETIKGMYINNTAWAVNSIEKGDYIAGQAFVKGDWYKTTVSGYNKDGKLTKTLDIYLADYRSENSSEHYTIKNWEWVDLSSLGKVSTVRFTVSGSRTNEYGLITPGYFCIDNFNCDKYNFPPSIKNKISDIVATDNSENTIIDLNTIFEDKDGDVITYSIESNESNRIVNVSITKNNLIIDYIKTKSGKVTITIVATSNNQTVKTSFNVTVSIATSIENFKNENKIMIYPNPCLDLLKVKSKQPIKLVSIYSLDGNLIFTKKYSTNSVEIETENYIKGIYVIKIEMENKIISEKIIKK